MLISQTSDGKENTEGDERRCYETANELFEIMANNSQFDSSDETLTASDLVILYKNLDVGTRLVTEAKYSKTKPSNQYVETVIYDHDSDESDIGEIYSTEDIRNIMMINKERIDLFNNTASFENTLCQKLGNLAMNSSNFGTTYDKKVLFQDIKDQLNSFMPAMTDIDVLPSSLLDYICCKRLEDNSNLYMDNIIRYVQHTIEQLKRISNGDYLTEKAKAKWRQADNVYDDNDSKKSMLANSVSIPLHMERKSSRIKSTLHDIVHSEVDIRSLSKLLEKKIVIEIPRFICGTYKLFTKRCNDNLIISCKKEVNSLNETPSRVDVVLKLKKSESGLLISKLDSIKIVQAVPQQSIQDCLPTPMPAIAYNPVENIKSEHDIPKVEELDEHETTSEVTYEYSQLTNRSPDTCDDSFIGVDTDTSAASFAFCKNHDYNESFLTYPNLANIKSYSDGQTEANFSMMSPDALRYSLQRLNMHSPVLEESEFTNKKKSPTRIRVKSPYENSSHAMEEKKRKRLLEIRERREMKKKSLSDNCKRNKNKYAKGIVMAQASSSVTKLSITNKSFYNSIYGQSINESKFSKRERKSNNQDLKIVVELENCEEETRKKSPRSPRNKEKYINHSYYLDDADTEVMHLENKLKLKPNMEDVCTASSSGVSDDLRSSLNMLKDIISFDNVSHPVSPISRDSHKCSPRQNEVLSEKSSPLLNPTGNVNAVPSNTPKDNLHTENHRGKDSVLPVQCRKSIDKIYDLMNKLGKIDSTSSNNKIPEYDDLEIPVKTKQISSSVQPSDSGTSLKHHLVSSNPSCFSFEKVYLDSPVKKSVYRKSEIPIATIPKNKTSTKSSEDKQKKDRKKITSPGSKISENPLKAISRLLRDFENVQNKRPKTDNEPKSKRFDTDKKYSSRQVTFSKSVQQEPDLKPSEPSSRGSTPKNKKSRANTLTHVGRSQYHLKSTVEEKPVDKLKGKKITDIIDEVKEARGEAVRGPPKSRLDSLAQPRKYNQPSCEQLSNRNKYNVQRPQRATNTITQSERRDLLNVKMRQRRGTEISGSQKSHSTVPHLEIRRSESTSPDRICKRSPVLATGPSYKSNVPEAPETLLKKMVAVESYVNNHYGRVSPIRELKGFSGAQKSRVPLVPIDLDMGSITSSRTAEESTVLGKKLHNIIDTMINSAAAPGLTSLCEKKETSESIDSINDAFVDTIEHYEELISNTEFPIDVFGDKSITTAVASLPEDNDSVFSKNVDFNVVTYDIQPFNSLTELARLENALYRRLSAGAFQKRLRIKNLTLTPKHSLQQILVLQSGDVGSLVVKSTLSQNVLRKTSSKIKEMAETKKPIESKSYVDWTFAKFPTQVSTVAYSIPNTGEVNSVITDSKKVISTDEQHSCNSSSKKSRRYKTDKSDTAKKKVEDEQEVECNSIIPHELDESKITQDKTILNIKENRRGVVDEQLAKNEEFQHVEKASQKSCVLSNSKMENKSSKVDNSTSLDILVGLLNEIRNITTCQTYLTENKTDDTVCDELEVILKRAEFKEHSADLSPINAISTNSLESYQQQNMCYLYKTNYHILNDEVFLRSPLHVDKEVNVRVPEIAYTHTLTDVQSKFFPITVHHSTNVTSSLVGVISEPSEQSMYFFSDYNTLYCNTSFNKIIELPAIETRKSCINALAPVWCGSEKKVRKDKKINKITHICQVNDLKQNTQFDPILKIKRDILVTVYSVLVMTVFAALSFSEVFYRL